MGQVSPASAPRDSRAGISMARTFLMATVYLFLVPVVAFAGFWVGAMYFPDATRSLLQPALLVVLGENSQEGDASTEALLKTGGVEERLARIEADISGLLERQSPKARTGNEAAPADPDAPHTTDPVTTAPATPEITLQEFEATVHESAQRDRALAVLSAVTLARVQTVTGNREVALREAELALGILRGSDLESASEEAQEMLRKAVDDLRNGSPTADDRLSLVWHSLVEAVSPALVSP